MILTLCCLNVMGCNYDKMLHLEGETFDMKIGQNCKFELCCVSTVRLFCVIAVSVCVKQNGILSTSIGSLLRVSCVVDWKENVYQNVSRQFCL